MGSQVFGRIVNTADTICRYSAHSISTGVCDDIAHTSRLYIMGGHSPDLDPIPKRRLLLSLAECGLSVIAVLASDKHGNPN